MVAGAARIRITFQVDADGLLSVTAREETTGTEARIEVKPSYGLSDQDISRMLAESVGHIKDDIETRKLREAVVNAQRLIDATHRALAQDADLLSNDEQAAIDTAMTTVIDAIITATPQTINDAIHQLNHATEIFANKRMDRHIQRALQGRNIADL